MLKMICFDLDGSLVDLYGYEDWLTCLRNNDPSPYRYALPLWNMRKLASILQDLQRAGIEIRIITWLSKESDRNFSAMTRKAKRDWLNSYGIPYDHFHGVAYGTTKADSVRKYLADNETALLIDDNVQVRKGWHLGATIDPTQQDVLEELEKILHEICSNPLTN